MTSEEAVYELAVHLLGENWCIVDPVGTKQANDDIVNAIKKYYPAAKNTPVEKWRLRHKRCAWCVYNVCSNEFNPISKVYEPKNRCSAKEKVINDTLSPRPFCTLFNLKREN